MDPITLGSLALGAGNFVKDLVTGERSYQNQNAENAIARSREDNAIQRRVADLKAAGLAPYLAAGQPAQSQAMHVGPTPESTPPDIAQQFANEAQRSIMAGQKNLIQAQIIQAAAATKNTEANTRNTDIDTVKKGYEAKLAKLEGDTYIPTKIFNGATKTLGMIPGVGAFLGKMFGKKK